MRFWTPTLFVLCALTSIAKAQKSPSVSEPTISVDEVLKLSLEKSESLRAIDLSIRALEAEIRGRDLILSPKLTTDFSWFRDSNTSFSSASDTSGNLMSLTLSKPFSTGTDLAVTTNQEIRANQSSWDGNRTLADWEVRVSQSLWQDAFGRSTRLRHSAELAELKSRKLQNLFLRQQFLISVENTYWDLVFALKEIAVRQDNVERSTSLEGWLRKRMGRFAAEVTDLLQVQALLTTRKLDLIGAQDRLRNAQTRFKQLIPGVQPESWKLDMNQLEAKRDPRNFLFGNSSVSSPVRLDVLSSNYRTEQLRLESERVSDSLNPTLQAYASYGASGVDSQSGTAWQNTNNSQHTGSKVGVLFSLPLDGDLKDQQRRAAALGVEAQQALNSALTRESALGWADLEGNYKSLSLQVQTARELSDLQLRKIRAERRRFEQGRTTSLQLTTFEVDAAESELRLYRLLTDLRKMENSARIFGTEESK